MKTISFLIASFKRGVFIVVPLLLLLFLLNLAAGFILELIKPLASLLPEGSLFGMGLTNLAAFTILLVVTVIVGIISRQSREFLFIEKIEKVIPGYSVVKKFLQDNQSTEQKHKILSCLATIDDAWLFAFILEEGGSDGMLTVFVPSAPTPTSGNIYFMTEQQVKRLDLPTKEVIKCITQLGIGSKKMLEGKVKW